MATVAKLVQGLNRRGVQLWTEGSRIKYRAPSGSLSPEIREAIRKHREEVRSFLEAQEEAKKRGWVILEAGEAYERRLTKRSALYLFREETGWCVWRGYWLPGRSQPLEGKTLAERLTFEQALSWTDRYLISRG